MRIMTRLFLAEIPERESRTRASKRLKHPRKKKEEERSGMKGKRPRKKEEERKKDRWHVELTSSAGVGLLLPLLEREVELEGASGEEALGRRALKVKAVSRRPPTPMRSDESFRDPSELESWGTTSTEGVTSPIGWGDIGAAATKASSQGGDELRRRWSRAEMRMSTKERKGGNVELSWNCSSVFLDCVDWVEDVFATADHHWSG
jgi:hypothetical protein